MPRRRNTSLGLVACSILFIHTAERVTRSAVQAQTSGEKLPVATSIVSEDVAARAAIASPLVLLLHDGSVRNELRLETSQATAIDKLLMAVDYSLWHMRDAEGAETLILRARAFDQMEKSLATILTAEQTRRLDGLLLQSHGWPVILVPRFRETLTLTADQLARIRILLTADATKSAGTDPEMTSAQQKTHIQEVLTDEQRRKLTQLVGKPFDTKTIRSRACTAPPFEQIDAWINTEPLTWDKLDGKVVAVHFWAFGCINCKRNLPHYQSWYETYAGKGLFIVGMHTPETQAERVPEAVREKVAENGIRYPIALDGAAKNWNAWATRWWPSVYLVDKQGYIRYWWYGELNWQGANGEKLMRLRIEELLAE